MYEALADARATLNAEMAKPENERDMFVIWDCQGIIDHTPDYKQQFIDAFKDGGDHAFLNKAEGGFIFTADVVGKDVAFDFIVDKAFPATVYSFHAPSVIDGSSRHGSDSRIHSRRVTSGCQDADCLYLCHILSFKSPANLQKFFRSVHWAGIPLRIIIIFCTFAPI